MGDFRARDTDRSRHRALVEYAYATGRLGAADRELRMTRIREAESREELDALTRDLHLYVPAPHQTPVETVLADYTPLVRTPRRQVVGSGTTGRVAGVLVALGTVVVLLGVGVTALVSLAGVESGSGTSTASEEAPVMLTATELDAAQVRAFVRAYPERFGTSRARALVIGHGSVLVDVPLSGATPSSERWAWDGSWHQRTTAAPVEGPGEPVDLSRLDVRRLVANAEVARASLGPGGLVVRVVVADRGDGPRVVIDVRDDSGGRARLVTTMGGRVVGGSAA